MEQVESLQKEFRKMRHDINNHLAVIIGSAELIRTRPEMTPTMLSNLAQKPADITAAMRAFSDVLNAHLSPGENESGGNPPPL